MNISIKRRLSTLALATTLVASRKEQQLRKNYYEYCVIVRVEGHEGGKSRKYQDDKNKEPLCKIVTGAQGASGSKQAG